MFLLENGKPHRNENEVIDGGSEAQPSNPFMTARDQFVSISGQIIVQYLTMQHSIMQNSMM